MRDDMIGHPGVANPALFQAAGTQRVLFAIEATGIPPAESIAPSGRGGPGVFRPQTAAQELSECTGSGWHITPL